MMIYIFYHALYVSTTLPFHFLEEKGMTLNALSSVICIFSLRQFFSPSKFYLSITPEFIQSSSSSQFYLILILMPFIMSMNVFFGLIILKMLFYHNLPVFFFSIRILKKPPPMLLESYHYGFNPSLNRYISQSIIQNELLESSLVFLRN